MKRSKGTTTKRESINPKDYEVEFFIQHIEKLSAEIARLQKILNSVRDIVTPK